MNWRALLHRWSRMDWLGLCAAVALVVTGVLFIYSAGRFSPDQAHLYRSQIAWALLGCGILLGVAAIDYRRLGDQAVWLYLIALAVLVLVLFAGTRIHGARRWLNLFGTDVQPSEFAKVATVLMLAREFSRVDLDFGHWSILVRTAALAGAPFLLIAVEPDLGTAMVLVPVAWVMLLIAGTPPRLLLALAAAAILVAPAGWFLLDGYQQERVRVFLNPGLDPLGAGWNKIQSAIAVGSGGLHGKGWLEGTQNVLGYLPRPVAPTDFIYSVIAEETGFVGSVVLLGLYAVVLGGAIRAATGAPNKYGQLLAAGLATMLFFHVFVNMAMTIGLLPITGKPLPLVSYGGSFMTATMLSLGLVQSVYARRFAAG